MSSSSSSTMRATTASAAALTMCAAVSSGRAFLSAAPAGAAVGAPAVATLRSAPASAASPASGLSSAMGVGCAAVAALGMVAATAAAKQPRAAKTVRLATIAGRRRSGMEQPDDDDDLDIESPQLPDPSAPFNPALQAGVTPPLMYFDPAGFCKEGDLEGFRNLRAAELKHGRVAMLAALGFVMQSLSWFRFPGFNDVPGGVAAVLEPPGTYGLVALVLAVGGIELTVGAQDPEKDPGDFGDPAGLGQTNMEWKHRELNNGRMAMFSVMGIIAAEVTTGKLGIDQFQPVGNLPVE